MALFTKAQAKKRFAQWAETFVSEHNLTSAYNDGDEQKILKAAKSAKLSDKETDALMNYLFPSSTSNTYTKSTKRKESVMDRVDGNKLSNKPSRLARKSAPLTKPISVKPMVKKLDTSRNDLTPEDAADAALISAKELGPESYVRVSTSADVIYNPGTQSTPFSARQAIKMNLERRIPGSTVKVLDVAGDGLAKFLLNASYEVDPDFEVSIVARCLCSPTDMTITQISATCNDREFNIDPVDQARSPEDAAIFLKRLVGNIALG